MKKTKEEEISMRIIISRGYVDMLLIDEDGEIVESNRTNLAKPASIEGIKNFFRHSIYRFADTFQDALYIWEGPDE